MRRKIAIITAVVFLIVAMLPLQSFAAGLDKSLENAIKIAKSKFDIGDDYKFESNISSDISPDGTKKVFYLTWTSKDTTDYRSINVTIDENGNILNYNSYSPNDYTPTQKLPAISKQEAMEKAIEYIEKIDPALPAQIKFQEQPDNRYQMLDNYYYFNYYRVVNGLPFYTNSVSININKQTGALQSFYRNWNYDIAFPMPSKITEDEAKESYKKNLGLKLAYKYNYNYDTETLNIFPAYVPVYDNSSYALDATTGERIKLYGYYGIYYDAAGEEAAQAKSMSSEVILTPDELKAVEEAGKLITQEEAEKIAKEAKFLGIDSTYKPDYYSLYPIWPVRTEYMWNLSYSKQGSGSVYEYVSVGINANTGLIMNFSKYSSLQQDTKAKYDLEDAKNAADNFLKLHYPDLYNSVKYDEAYTNNYIIYSSSEMPLYYSLKYNRLVNGTEFPDNGFNIEYNAVTGEISGMWMTWFNGVKFPAIDNAISLDEAYEALFENIGLSLEYRLKDPANYGIIRGEPQKSEPVLVFALNGGKPHLMDAFTGNVINYDGTAFKESKPIIYKDIEGSFAEEQIKVLAENGIYLEGDEFKPNAVITQKDFFILLSKTMPYYGKYETQTDIDNMYAYLIREGVVLKEEKAPDAELTREDGVKFIIRAMKYNKIADLTGIFKENTFKDTNEITKGLEGYVALAYGLKIVKGYDGYFNPKGGLTRAAAAVMLYNYLQAL